MADRYGRRLLPATGAATIVALLALAIVPAPAHAVDLFPVDDWIGSGLKSVGKVALGGLEIGAKELAKLLAGLVVALADLLIPKSLIKAGLEGIRWLVQLPPLGTDNGADSTLRMPHLMQLRDTLAWVGLTLLPLQLVIAGGRAMLAPSADGDSPAQVLERALLAGLGLLTLDWGWGALTRLTRLITDALLSLPWVADGIQDMFQTLVIGSAAGAAVASEFVIPLVLTVAGGALLALLLLRVALEVVAALIYVLGGLVLGLAPSRIGYALLHAWLYAAVAVFVLPVLWTVVFVVGAALILDADPSSTRGFAGFVAQLYNVGAALVTFGIAIKLARATMSHAGSAISGLAGGALASGSRSHGGRSAGAGAAAAQRAVPASVAAFSQRLRGGVAATARTGGRVATYPARHPARGAQAAGATARHPAQATRDDASRLCDALGGAAGNAAALGDASRPRLTQGGAARSRRAGPASEGGGRSRATGPAESGRRQQGAASATTGSQARLHHQRPPVTTARPTPQPSPRRPPTPVRPPAETSIGEAATLTRTPGGPVLGRAARPATAPDGGAPWRFVHRAAAARGPARPFPGRTSQRRRTR